MRTVAPKATFSPTSRKLAGAILAVLVLPSAFVTAGAAGVSEKPVDTGTTAISEPTNPVDAARPGVPILSSDGTGAAGDGGRALVSNADAQRPTDSCEREVVDHDNYKIHIRFWFDPKGHSARDGAKPRAPWEYDHTMLGERYPEHYMFWENGWAKVHHKKCDPR